jgi:Tol biopolymer transport system component
LARAADPRGGSWSRDGGILISVNSTAPIVRVVPGSGASQSATELAQNRGEQSHRFPWALSTGGFLFTSTGSPEIQGIYWQGRDAAAPQRIVPDLSRAACDERGFLFWVRDGVLVAQRFDPEKGELSGEPIAIAELTGGDAQVPAEFWFSVSASGTIALRPGSGLGTELVWLDRSGAALGAASPPGAYREPALSPDGRWVAVDVSPVGKRDEVYIVDASALDQSRRLTFDAAGAETPIWSPDGRWVAYSSPRTNGWDLLRKAADGSGGEELLFAAGTASWVDSWSPDGSTLLFERYVPEQGSDLWLLPLEGERRATPLLVTPANESHASFSPDGRLVAYVSDESGVAEVYVRTLAASGGRWQVSRGGGDWPAWSADGKELFYAGLDRLLQSAPIKSLEPYSFGSPEPLFRLRTYEPKITSNRNNFVPAPDGRRFLVSQRVGEERDTRVDVLVNWRPTGASP